MQKSEDKLDQFGGWKGKQFEATGFFRVEKDGGLSHPQEMRF